MRNKIKDEDDYNFYFKHDQITWDINEEIDRPLGDTKGGNPTSRMNSAIRTFSPWAAIQWVLWERDREKEL